MAPPTGEKASLVEYSENTVYCILLHIYLKYFVHCGLFYRVYPLIIYHLMLLGAVGEVGVTRAGRQTDRPPLTLSVTPKGDFLSTPEWLWM